MTTLTEQAVQTPGTPAGTGPRLCPLQADVYQSAWRLEQADVSHSDTEQTEAERTERARRQYLSHYERRRALPEVFPSARIMGRGDSPRPWGFTEALQH